VSAIAGIIHFDGRPEAKSDLARMMRPLVALGPDRQASWSDGAAALGFGQMTLMPEDRYDRQPWRGRDGALVMTAAARIDNRDELGRALGLADASAMADSEMLLKAYERWDKDCLSRLVGDFTFAVWDLRDRRLFCARSHLGGRPFYYYRSRSFFAFATTCAGLFALPDVPRALDDDRLVRSLALLPAAGQQSFYRDVFSLPRAHWLSATQEDVTVERYWRLDATRRLTLAKDDDYVEALRETFGRAVSAQLRSIHPVGAQLSSGCDSSAVTATAARLLAAEQRTITAFTAAPREGFDGLGLGGRLTDESPFAAALAARIPNLDHVVLRSDGRTPLDGLDRGHLLFGRPAQTAANLVWIERILDAARERRIRVLLTGEAGNMTISYDGMPRLAALFRTGRWITLAREAAALKRNGRGGIVDAALCPYMPYPVWSWWQRAWHKRSVGAGSYAAINPAYAAAVDLDAMAAQSGHDLLFRPFRDGRVMRRTFLELQEQGDQRIGVLAGWRIDLRDPTSDRRVVEFCLAVPEDQYLRDGVPKFLYRRAFANLLPTAEILARKRGYQAADWYEGLTAARHEIAAELNRMERSARARRTLDLPRLRRLVEEWPTEGWHRAEVVQNYRLALTRAVAASRFIRFVEGGNE
jgi:asparagine synthase (glutamine-hydrolysing)